MCKINLSLMNMHAVTLTLDTDGCNRYYNAERLKYAI